jgi:hypothetical protein
MPSDSTIKYSLDWDKEASQITTQESDELDALKKAICEHPASVHPDKMERFTELFVKTLPKAL